MRTFLLIGFLCLPTVILAQPNTGGMVELIRITANLNANWKFAKGDPPGAAGETFNDASWRTVNLPHDWAIEGPFVPELSGETGKRPWQGQAWYRKKLPIRERLKDKKFFLCFDGVMAFPKIYVNGKLAGSWDYGYSSFYFDITPYLRFGSSNTLAVYVDTRNHDSRWYPGAGIYRKVRLIVTDKVHAGIWRTHITTPEVAKEQARVRLHTTVFNEAGQDELVSITQRIVDQEGKTVAVDSASCPVKASESHQFEQFISLSNPALWDIENPYLYTLVTQIHKQGQVCDEVFNTFGVRTFKFTPDDGFWLNGRRVQMKGVNLHHDLGALGAAFNTKARARQLRIMKEMGCNAIRTSHNAPAPELLDLCDQMGLLVIDELFDKFDGKADLLPGMPFAPFADRHAQNFIYRDYNHPSIILWSVGNEIGDVQGNVDGGFEKLRSIVASFRKYDASRPVTLVCDNKEAARLRHMDYYDVVAYNYGRRYAIARELAPEKAVIISESASTLSTRGFYSLPLPESKTAFADTLQLSSYDLNAPWWAEIPEDDFEWQKDDLFVTGEFVWTGFDYLGEPTPFGDGFAEKSRYEKTDLPRSSYFGIVDLAGLLKDRYYLYKSVWKPRDTTIHILPHWNWEGREGQNIPVFVYTNGDCAELFLNDRSLGRRCKNDTAGSNLERYRLMWHNVPYAPGKLRVVAYLNGQVLGEQTRETAGKASQLRLTADRRNLTADGEDLCFVTVEVLDDQGRVVPHADQLLKCSISGPAKIAAVDNGNPRSMKPFQRAEIEAFYGKAMVIVRTVEGQAGSVQLTVSNPGLKEAGITLEVR